VGLSLSGAGLRRRSYAGTSDHPTPRIKLVFDSTSSESESETNEHLLEKLHLRAPVREDTSDLSSNNESFTRFEEVSECEASTSHPLVDKLYGVGVLPADDVSPPGSPSDITPTSRLSRKSRSSATLVRIPGKQREVELHDIDLPDAVLSPVPARLLDVPTVACTADESSTDDGDFADDEEARAKSPSATLTPSSPKRKKRRRHSRVIYIPLKSDTEFYTLLARALQSLQDLEEKQKVVFAQQVEELSRIVSKVASPSNSKGDMYNWREIFSLWVEAQIFESAREKDRGERSLQQAEERLDWFVDQVGRRKLATKMKSKESRQALEEFLDLNITLLDLKRFIRMNEEAARKILKKHDKRTALTATSNFPQFLHHLNAPTAGEAGALTKYDLSLPDSLTLPHVLLATMTQTLLPIIPQIDDYTCVICGDVSYKPIRLDCGHYFCLRCLVKMQKRKQDAVSLEQGHGSGSSRWQCPQCRAPVVLKADGREWFVATQRAMLIECPQTTWTWPWSSSWRSTFRRRSRRRPGQTSGSRRGSGGRPPRSRSWRTSSPTSVQ
jgi:hypothetical protein